MNSTHSYLAVSLALLSPALIAQDEVKPQFKASLEIQNKQYAKALQLLDAYISGQVPLEDKRFTIEQLYFLKATAQLQLKQYAEAAKTASQLIAKYPEGKWRFKATFLIAESHVLRRQFKEAMQVYEAQAKRLFAHPHKQEVAEELIKFAKLFAKAKDPNDLDSPAPNYQKSYLLYQEVLDVECGSDLHQEAHLQMIEMQRKMRNYNLVEQHSLEYTQAYDPSWRGKIGSVERVTLQKNLKAKSQGKHAALIRYYFAEALHRQNRRREADAYLNELIKQINGGELKAQPVLLADATWLRLHALTQQGGKANDIDEWITAARNYLKKHPKHEHADKTALLVAQKLSQHNKTKEAILACQDYISNKFNTHATIAAGNEKAVKLNEKHLETAYFLKGSLLEASEDFDKARATWTQALRQFPNGERWSDTQQRISKLDYKQLSFEINRLAEEKNPLKAADTAVEKIDAYIDKHPLDPEATKLLFLKGKIPHTLAKRLLRSDENKKPIAEQLFRTAISNWNTLHSKHPNSEMSKQALVLSAQIYDSELKMVEKAIEYYKRANTSAANQALAILSQKQLQAFSPKTFTSAEQAVVELTTRNIKEVKVHQYWVDMESYFQKSRNLQAATSLDVDLIEPDKTWEVKIENYKKHELKTSSIKIPFEANKPGVCIIKIESEDFETTTLVHRSNIDIALRSSKKELMVFVKDSLKNAPCANAKILIAEGEKIVHRGTTDENGILHSKFDKLKDLSNYRILAISESNTATLNQSVGHLVSLPKTKPKAWLFLSNHEIRKGDMATLNGVVRDRNKTDFIFPKHKSYKLIIRSGNTTIKEETITLSNEGNFSSDFKIPERTRSNNISCELVSTENEADRFLLSTSLTEHSSYQGEVDLTLSKKAIKLGETIECNIEAHYRWGAPISNRSVTVTLPSGRQTQIITDAEGKASIQYDTTGIASGSVIQFQASIAGERAKPMTALATIDPLDLFITAEADKEKMTAGESLKISIETKNHSQDPSSNPLSLKVLKRTNRESLDLMSGNSAMQFDEEVFLEKKLTSNKEGKVEDSIKIDKGGVYVLRIEGKDADGKPSFTETTVEVLDESSVSKLSLYHHNGIIYDDDQAKLHLHSTLKGKTKALMTIETDRIVKYSLIDISPGLNDISIPLEASYAPSFRCSIIGFSERKFVSCENIVAITKKLHVSSKLLNVKNNTAKAGSKIKARVEIKDSKGKIVPAILFSTLNSTLKGVADVTSANTSSAYTPFVRDQRIEAFAMSTSSGFNHRSYQQPILAALKEESQRQQGSQLQNHQMLVRSNADRVREQLDKAQSFTNLNRMNEALACINVALSIDPYNEQAKRQLDALSNQLVINNKNLAYSRNNGSGIGNGMNRFATNFGAPLNNDQIAGIPQVQVGSVFNMPTSGLRSGDTAITRDSINFFLNNPSGGGQFGSSPIQSNSINFFLNNPTRTSQTAQAIGNSIRFNGFDNYSNRANGISTPVFAANPVMTNSENQSDAQILSLTGLFNDPLNLSSSSKSSLPIWQAKPLLITKAHEVEIELPSSAGHWLLEFDTVGDKGRSGYSSHVINTVADYSVHFENDSFVVEGDRFEPAITIFRKESKKAAKLKLKVSSGSDNKLDKDKNLEVEFEAGEASKTLALEMLEVPNVDSLIFKLDVEGVQHRHSIPVRPWGMLKSASMTHQITAGSSKEWKLTTPANASAKQLDFIILPQFDKKLIQLALSESSSSLGVYLPCEDPHPAGKLLGLTAVLDYLRSVGAEKSSVYSELHQKATWSFNDLISSRLDDGSWSIVQHRSYSHLTATALSYEAIKKWEKHNRIEDCNCPSTEAWLKKQYTSLSSNQFEQKCLIQMALSHGEGASFSICNRLNRDSAKLSTAAKIFLAQALLNLDRKEMAKTLVKQIVATDMSTWKGSEDFILRNPNFVQGRMLSLIASLDGHQPLTKKLYEKLTQGGTSVTFSHDFVRGYTIQGLAAARKDLANRGLQVSKGNGKVFLNGELKFSFDLSKPKSFSPSSWTEDLKAQENKLKVEFSGQGEIFATSTVHGLTNGYLRHAPPKNTYNVIGIYNREYFHPKLKYKGIPLSSNSETKAKVVEQGQRVKVKITAINTIREHKEAILLEHIPAGFSYVPKSLTGGHSGARIENGYLVITLRENIKWKHFSYDLVATETGIWKQQPSIIANLGDIENAKYGPTGSLTVSKAGIKTTDKYQHSYSERLELAKKLFDDLNYAEAEKHLKVLREKHKLSNYTSVARMNLWIEAAKKNPNSRILVDSFEVLDANDPNLSIPFEKILKVASAYSMLREFERAYTVFSATVDAGYKQDSYISASLEDQGRLLDSIDYLKKLWYHYPNNNEVNTAWFATAQNLFDQAARSGSLTPRKGSKQKKITSEEIYQESIDMMETFLSMNPEHPSADEASYTIANALFALNDYPAVVEHAIASRKRYADSSLKSSFQYMEALGTFWQRKYDEAIKAAQSVAEGNSDDKDLATFIIAQIFHANNRFKEAQEWYEKVKNKYPDARESIQYFENKSISFDEVTVLGSNEKAKLTLNYRNIDAAHVKIYRVDLMKLYLKQKNLANITKVNLTGIAPELEREYKLGGEDRTKDMERTIALPIKEEGAYLVICRGDYLYSSGLVLITPLKMKVQEFPGEGRIRVNVKDSTTGGLLDNVHVKAIGSRDQQFKKGETDLRGVWSTQNITGVPTVIARDKKGRYAFFRSKTLFGGSQSQQLEQQQERKAVDYKGNLKQKQFDMNSANWGSWNEKRRANKQMKGIKINDALKK